MKTNQKANQWRPWKGHTAGVERETRQTIRGELRRMYGDAPGKQEWRKIRGLPELKDRENFKAHSCGRIDAK